VARGTPDIRIFDTRNSPTIKKASDTPQNLDLRTTVQHAHTKSKRICETSVIESQYATPVVFPGITDFADSTMTTVGKKLKIQVQYCGG
jgi:hypothetical protein